MIKISNLSKTYQTKNRILHKAIKELDLDLPDKGLVFVLGKSGSGKSTLLNLIGGLDYPTGGSILVEGNPVSAMTPRQYVDYRNDYIGFIFQDHHLIDDLTIYDNIKLVLDLQNRNEPMLIHQSLEKVGLAGYEYRYPAELSGGERQRVAIARAIAKEPRIILADEPTGNLDGKNAAQVMDILRGLAETCLILIVSHNVPEVYANAHRIIELEDGRIIGDLTRNPDYPEGVCVEGDTLVCPGDRHVTDEDAACINAQLNGGKAKRFVLRKDRFVETTETPEQGEQAPIYRYRLRFDRVMSLSRAFLRTKVKRILGSAATVSFIMVILLLAQTFIHFDSNRILREEMEKAGQKTIILDKQISLDGVQKNARIYHVPVSSTDEQAFRDAGFKKEIYPILSLTVPINTYRNGAGIKTSYFTQSVVLNETMGTMIVDEEFLDEQFDGWAYLAKQRNFDPLGVLITDFTADVILMTHKDYKGKTYKDLLGSYSMAGWGTEQVYINGVIDTGYATRYADLIDRIVAEKITDPAALYNDGAFQELSAEIYGPLSYSYTFNENYIADSIANRESSFYWSHKLAFSGGKDHNTSTAYVSYDAAKGLKNGQVSMSYRMYNEIFGTNYNDGNLGTFTPKTVTMSQYGYYDTENKDAMFKTEVTIVSLHNGGTMFVSADVRDLFAQNHIRQTGLFLNGIDAISNVLDVASDRNFTQESLTVEGILTMTRAVKVFSAIFSLINIGLCIAVVLVFVAFATKMIRDKLHEIGIMKALGTSTGTICWIFGLQIALVALFTCLISTVGYYALIDIANTILVESMKELVPSQLVLEMRFLAFDANVLLRNFGLIAALSVVSLFTPLRRISKVQPVQIIKAHE